MKDRIYRIEGDLTDLLSREKVARKSAEEATRQRDHMLSVVSHDLKNPLTTIGMNADLIVRLMDVSGGGDLAVRAARSIRSAVDRMNRLVCDLLDVAQLDHGGLRIERNCEDWECIRQEIVDMVLPLAQEKSQTVSFPALDGKLCLICDRQRLVQVFMNVIGNAIKFSPVGSEICVFTEVREEDVRFVVEDEGPGIQRENVPHVFDRFWQAKRGSYDGIGLGLAIAREIVRNHGGEIWVESEPGRGTRFIFTLPGRISNQDTGLVLNQAHC